MNSKLKAPVFCTYQIGLIHVIDCAHSRVALSRASEHVELKLNDIPRRSRDVVDDVCDKLDFTTQRLERLEERLDRLAT